MKDLEKDIKNITERISEVIKKHQIKRQEPGDWTDFNDPRYKEGKVKEKVIWLLRDSLEIEEEIEKINRTNDRTRELSELSKKGV